MQIRMSGDDSCKVSRLFQQEAKNFERMIAQVPERIGSLSIAEIVQCYYQVMNISSMIKALKPQSAGQGKELAGQIAHVEGQIREKFDRTIHPAILLHISESTRRQTMLLKESKKTEEKTKESIENEAKMYEKLREAMSTKEFVEQYDKELDHD